ncbi:MAG: hypothetical protein MO853_11020 [Candidatus Protistobacter heckmanni]|nr:hypothetical protein [Candidatus Protistobacter heckmanni]
MQQAAISGPQRKAETLAQPAIAQTSAAPNHPSNPVQPQPEAQEAY